MTDETKQLSDMMKDLFSALNDKIEASNQELKSEIKDIKNEMKDMKMDIAQIKTTIENETNKNIQLLAEGYTIVYDKIKLLDSVPDKLDELQSDVTMIKNVVADHSTEIYKLTKVK